VGLTGGTLFLLHLHPGHASYYQCVSFWKGWGETDFENTPGSPASSSGALSTGQSWSCGSGARGGPSHDVRAGTPLLGGKAGRAGAAQPGEEKAVGTP